MNGNLSGAIVVGSGSIAKRHIRNLRTLFPEAVVTCVSSTGRLISTSEVGSTQVANDIAEALSITPENRIAIVASPATQHLSQANELLRKGVYTLIEKPLCVCRQEIKQHHISRYKDRIGVAYNLRYLPALKIVRELLEKKVIGKIQSAFAEVGQYLPDWRPGSDYSRGVSARSELGGGALLELSHELDYLSCFFGNFKKVVGIMRNSQILDIDVEDNVDALLESSDGTIVHIHLDFTQRHPTRFFKAIGESGTIRWDLHNNTVEKSLPSEETQIVYSQFSYDRNQMYLEQLKSFINFSLREEIFESSLDSSLNVMSLIEAIKRSSDNNKWEPVNYNL